MSCECGDPDCDPNYDADAFFSFDKTSDRDESSWSSSDPQPEYQETRVQQIYTVCGAVLVVGIIFLFLLLILAIPLTVLVAIMFVLWKIVIFTHYLMAIPILILGAWFLITLKFVMSDPRPRISKS